MLDFGFHNETANKGYSRKFFKTFILVGLKELNLDKRKIGISLNLVGNQKIRRLNKVYRGKDNQTDVLSFPLNKVLPRNALRDKTAGGILELGDIFISLPETTKKAKKENRSIRDELAILTVHGFLHLCGFDHEHGQSKARGMFHIQNKILNRLE